MTRGTEFAVNRDRSNRTTSLCEPLKVALKCFRYHAFSVFMPRFGGFIPGNTTQGFLYDGIIDKCWDSLASKYIYNHTRLVDRSLSYSKMVLTPLQPESEDRISLLSP